ncbi:MAG: UrcA family protein [Caulobacterales bacterium]|nr:UrcA family protein [Caulobacterales bacterium]
MKLSRLAAGLTMAAAMFAAAETAHASQASSIPSIAVSYADLDLNSPEGGRVLHDRLRRAAKSVCGGAPARDLRTRREQRACFRAAITEAVADMREPTVTMAHLDRFAWARRAAREFRIADRG